MVDDPDQADELADLAADVAAGEANANVVLTRFLPASPPSELASGLGADLSRMTASMDELHDLAARIEARGVRCTPTTRFSTDIAQDLVAQITSTDSDAVLLALDAVADVPPAVVAVLRDTLTCDVGLLVDPLPATDVTPGGPVVVSLVGGSNDGGALEARAALRPGPPGPVEPGRRC